MINQSPKKSLPPLAQCMVDTGEKTWLTPKWILDLLGDFDLDPCCPDGGMPWQTARRMVTKAEDGLSIDWNNQRVWLNPPYGKEAIPFFEKMINHTGGGVALVFARTENRLWQDLIFPNAEGIIFIRGRLRFCLADGTQGDFCPAPSALIAFTKEDADLLCDLQLKDAIHGNFIYL